MRRIHKSAWLFVLLSAGLQIAIFPLPNCYMLCWVALAPLLIALARTHMPDTLQLDAGLKLLPATPWQGFCLAYGCGIVWYAGTCYWIYNTMRQYGGVGTVPAAGILILFCLYLALYHGAFGWVMTFFIGKAASPSRGLLVAPIVWVAVELARTRVTGFPWDLLGTAQVDNIPLARIVTVTGAYGLSFEIMIVNVAFAAGLLVGKERRNRLLLAAVAALFALQAGRFVSPPAIPTDHAAHLAQANVPILEGADWTKDYFDATLRDLVQISLHPTSANGVPIHPDLIAWPESPAPFYTSDPLFRDQVSKLARDANTFVLAGTIGVRNASQNAERPTEIYNSAVLVSPGGDWKGEYDKVHLVPFGEYVPFQRLFSFAGGLTKEVGNFSRGNSRVPLNAGGTRLGIFICYESIFPDEVRQTVAGGAQVLVNLSNDGWYGDSGAYAQHLKQARLRAVENARWLLRDTNTGVTASIDPYGRVVAAIPRKVRDTLIAPYALSDGTTFYTRHGDWFAYLCAIISLGLLIIRIAK